MKLIDPFIDPWICSPMLTIGLQYRPFIGISQNMYLIYYTYELQLV